MGAEVGVGGIDREWRQPQYTTDWESGSNYVRTCGFGRVVNRRG